MAILQLAAKKAHPTILLRKSTTTRKHTTKWETCSQSTRPVCYYSACGENEKEETDAACVMARSHQLDTYLIQHKRMHKSKVTIFMRARLSSAVV
jgi:hypothetical protein